jgi:hypothetical protein
MAVAGSPGRGSMLRLERIVLAVAFMLGCGAEDEQAGRDLADDAVVPGAVYAASVESFTPGDHAGFGQGKFPDVVLGPPRGEGTTRGSLDVLSLGVGGEIVLGFGAHTIVDGEGPDFIVFENAFWAGGDPTRVFEDLGEVSVSEDGETWHTFPCDKKGDGAKSYPGCAGWRPTLMYDLRLSLLDPEITGGDPFDLADLGLVRARFVRIRDLATSGAGNNAGFDLDAIGLIHSEP